MVGQGSPLQYPLRSWPGGQHHGHSFHWCALMLMLIWCSALASATRICAADPLDIRVRMTWGEGKRQLWGGSISISEGLLSEPRCLGYQADAPNELFLEGQKLHFSQRTPVSFDGLDFRAVGPATATLSVELAPLDDRKAVKRATVRLSEFLPAVSFVRELPLDEHHSRLQLQRAPGDRVRVRLERDTLVFAPGEDVVLEVIPNALGLPAGAAIHCSIVLSSPVDQGLWKDQHDLRLDADGNLAPLGPIKVPLPMEEGVYDVAISLQQRRLGDAIGRIGDAIVPSRLLMQRKVQLVVIDSRPSPPEAAEWKLVEEIDSANPRWWAKWVWLPPLRLPRMSSQGPLGDPPLRVREHEGDRWKEIGMGGWHAAPIPISKVNEPHVLEIEYPAGICQTLGISILEPDATGHVGTQGIDSGVDVPFLSTGVAGVERHRIVFWPRTRTPWLVLSNRREDLPAVFGKLRVYAGPSELPVGRSPPARDAGQRLVAAFLDKPLFAANFGSPEALDAPSNRSLTDWNTFYVGATRFAQYLKYAGYNAAFVPVASDGMTLYPTQLLDTIPKCDNGTFFVSGQDPLPKDVLELLLRIFDREGLTLIPQLQFGVPLPELEELIRRERNDWNGLRLIGAHPNRPEPTLDQVNVRRGLAPYYNPLDPRVQSAMRRVAGELLARCAAHPSFGGLSLQLVPFGYAQLPDDSWALDDATFARFSHDKRLPDPPTGSDRFVTRLAIVRGEQHRDTWLKWRAEKLADFYQQLQSDVVQTNPLARLYLDAHDLVAGRVVQSSVRPQLPERDEFQAALLRHGLNSRLVDGAEGIVLLRPHRTAPLTSLPAQAANLELDHSFRVDEFFQRAGPTGMLLYHEPQITRLPGFDVSSPFGSESTYTRLTAHFLSAGTRSRANLVRSLVTLDTTVLAVGGWTVPLGKEDAFSPVLEVIRSLPAEKFTDVKSRSPMPHVAVRKLVRGNETHVYVANATGLRADVLLDVEKLPGSAVTKILPERQPAAFVSSTDDGWTARLEPFGIVAFVAATPNLRINDWRVSYELDDVNTLGRLVSEVQLRLPGLKEPQPLGVLENPGFEQPDREGQIPGWTISRQPGVFAALDRRQPRSGQVSLNLRVDKEGVLARVRSNQFALPKTGRVSLKARLRTRDLGRQPPLRLAIEGALADGTPFYFRSQPLGVPVPAQWPDKNEEFVFHLANLPAGVAGNLSVGFDMLGPGEVWIDDVEVFDLFFQEYENVELFKRVWSAKLKLEKGEAGDVERFVYGYWSRFVLEFGPSPRLTQAPAVPTSIVSPAKQVEPAPEPVTERPSRWRLLPLRLPFR
jgi:hypothetical protein